MLKIIQGFDKHCSCHLQGEFLMFFFLEALHRAGSSWRVGIVGADWWSGRARKAKEKNFKEIIKTTLKQCTVIFEINYSSHYFK
jgi:hypothetical protein